MMKDSSELYMRLGVSPVRMTAWPSVTEEAVKVVEQDRLSVSYDDINERCTDCGHTREQHETTMHSDPEGYCLCSHFKASTPVIPKGRIFEPRRVVLVRTQMVVDAEVVVAAEMERLDLHYENARLRKAVEEQAAMIKSWRERGLV